MSLEKMAKVRMVCSRDNVATAVDALYEFGAIQITRSKYGTPDLPLASFEEYAKALITLRAAEKSLSLKTDFEVTDLEPAEKLLEQFNALESEYAAVVEAEKKLNESKSAIASANSRLRELAPFAATGLSPKLFESGSGKAVLALFKTASPKEFQKIAKHHKIDVAVVSVGKAEYCVCAIDLRKVNEVERELSKHGVKVPSPKTGAKDFDEARRQLESELESATNSKKALESQIASFVEKRGGDIVRIRANLEEHARKAEVTNKFGRSTFIEVIEGWVPSASIAQLEKDVSDSTNGKVHVEQLGVREEPPVLLSNPRLLRRFEFLVRFFSLPKQEELDPTIYIGIAFPFFFGMILGDVGYGLLALALGAYLRYSSKKDFIKDIAGMMMLSGVFTTIFGFVYAEFFGFEEIFGYHMTPLVHRNAEGITVLIALSLLVGIIHLSVGYIIGVYTNWNHGHKTHAYAKASWLVLLLSLVGVAGTQAAPQFVSPGLLLPFGTLSVLAVVLLYKFEGLPAIVELPGLISNVLSYLRLMALGLSAVILAKIINQIPVGSAFDSLVKAGSTDGVTLAIALLTFIAFALVFALGHALAFVLGLFESSIQSLRLQYVEFFSKFYKGGGLPFSPFRKSR